jgi:hypothetical protein
VIDPDKILYKIMPWFILSLVLGTWGLLVGLGCNLAYQAVFS